MLRTHAVIDYSKCQCLERLIFFYVVSEELLNGNMSTVGGDK